MNLNHLITANQHHFQTITVRLATGSEGQIYTYKAPIDMVLAPGDTVIVSKNGVAKTGQPQYRPRSESTWQWFRKITLKCWSFSSSLSRRLKAHK